MKQRGRSAFGDDVLVAVLRLKICCHATMSPATFANETTNVGRCPRPAAARSGFPAPKGSEASTVPVDQRLRPYDLHRNSTIRAHQINLPRSLIDRTINQFATVSQLFGFAVGTGTTLLPSIVSSAMRSSSVLAIHDDSANWNGEEKWRNGGHEERWLPRSQLLRV
jgi:hypothetical protein